MEYKFYCVRNTSPCSLVTSGLDLPGLHKVAGDISAASQSKYLYLIRGEYLLLFIASVFAMDLSSKSQYYLIYAIVLIGGLATLLVRSFIRPEQSWYRARAVAESVKTSAWRYAMLAHPYHEEDSKRQFLGLLREVVRANKILSQGGSSSHVGNDQITASMEDIRSLPLNRRVAFYMENRVKDQRSWYIRKANSNKRAFIFWVWASGICYVAAIVMAMSHIAFPEWKIVPIDPLIVLASSIVGWVQLKKHSELASTYTLTATEIGIASEDAASLTDEKSFSDFVNDTELAFSREHTQWVARQQTAG